MKPGDIIEFIYVYSGTLVNENEIVWSTLTQSWCSVGSNLVHTCVTLVGTSLTWINEKGLFNARMDETWASAIWKKSQPTVVARAHAHES